MVGWGEIKYKGELEQGCSGISTYMHEHQEVSLTCTEMPGGKDMEGSQEFTLTLASSKLTCRHVSGHVK